MMAILKYTLLEVKRKKTFLVISIISAALLGLWLVGMILVKSFATNAINMGDLDFWPIAAALMLTAGAGIFLLLCVINTIMIGAGSLRSDAESGLLHAVLSRPIGRGHYLFGRAAGLMLVSVFFATVLYGGMFAIAGVLGATTAAGVGLDMVFKGWLLLILLQFSLLALTQLLGTRFKTVAVSILTISLYFISSIGPTLIAFGNFDMMGEEGSTRTVVVVGRVISFIAPFSSVETLFTESISGGLYSDMADMGLSLTAVIPDYMLYYTAGYTALLLLGAYWLFRKRDL